MPDCCPHTPAAHDDHGCQLMCCDCRQPNGDAECESSLALRWGSAACDLPRDHAGLHSQRSTGRTWTTSEAELSWNGDDDD